MSARTASPAEPKWLSRKDAARIYATSVWRIDELINSGAVVAKKDGRRKFVSAASLDRYYEGLEQA